MFALHTPNRTSAKASLALEQSTYLTDGTRLFRVVSGFKGSPQDSFAALEDCLTLEIAPYSPEQLWEMRLQPVRSS